MDNSSQRLNDVFFYGLYMDEEILKSKNVNPRNKRVAVVHNYELRIGKMATLLRKIDAKAYGLVYSLTHDEVDILYAKSGLTDYVAESLLAKIDDKSSIPVLCCNLLNPPAEDETNNEYYEKLKNCMEKYKLPFQGSVV
ncbi:gamma-glutamylcyclotransferase family protein [Sulfurospirillum arcachonense]|uniref:gamma-glutamylcyclotransferase family protein n=1 Tax=Sulfurospirillum arcachonense TaxID=57666 RepID=UPI00046A2104|nr:gamma-glutamylcyclotransferase family protein [Sulfurospirillum arcachonense]